MASIGDIAQIASAVFSLGLLAATGFYAYFTYQSIKTQANPFLKAGLEYSTSDKLHFVIQNTGKGAAHDVEAHWSLLKPAAPGRSWKIDNIPPNSKHRFNIPLPGEEQGYTDVPEIGDRLADLNGEIHFEAECENILRKSCEFEEKVEIRDALKRTKRSGETIQLEELEDIKNAIVELADLIEANSDT